MKTHRSMTLAALATLALLAGQAALAQADSDRPRSRSEVAAEVLAARAAGTLATMHGEDSGSFHLSRQPFKSRPRAEVVAELKEYRESGEMAALVAEELALIFYADRMLPSLLTRAQVRAEAIAARASGETAAMVGEDSGSFYLAQRGAVQAGGTFAGAAPGQRPQRAEGGSEAAAAKVSQLGCPNPAVTAGSTRYAAATR
ncbi:MAG: DUF4148 domain-containing protein [Rubrivivax sp.]